MKLIAAVEDRNGMIFNGRRVSKDKGVISAAENLASNGRLLIDSFSKDLFPDAVVDDAFLENAGENDYCFVEDRSVLPYADRVSDVYLFFWNRRYPSDLKFDLPMKNFTLLDITPIKGTSHDSLMQYPHSKRLPERSGGLSKIIRQYPC